MRKRLSCACGERRFRVRLHRAEQVGLLTCAKGGHDSLLLDSRDHWSDAIQEARPREARCGCGGNLFEVELEYVFREDSEAVRSIAVGLQCSACGRVRLGTTFEIDYEPTGSLLGRPLDPISDPWVRARQVELSALWLPSDVADVVSYIGDKEQARCYFAGWREPARPLTARDIHDALATATSFDLFFAAGDIQFPVDPRSCWKRLAVIHMSAPTQMNYRTGTGSLYYLHWAEEFLFDGHITRQDPALLQLAGQLRSWLQQRFVSARGARTVDNAGEFARLKGGW